MKASGKKKIVHSRAYHRYFEGYAEKMTYKSDGTPYITRVYVGNYYRRCLPRKKRVWLKMLYGSLYLIALTSLIVGGTRYAPVNTWLPVRVMSSVTLIVMLLLGLPVFYNITSPEQMIIRVYRRAHENMVSYGMAASICAVLLAATGLAYPVISGEKSADMSMFAILMYIVTAVAVFGIIRCEKNTKYEELPPENRRDPESSIINYYLEF